MSVVTPEKSSTNAAPTDAQLDVEVKHIIETGTLEDLSNKKVRRMLEAKFGCDLTARKAYIKTQVEKCVAALASSEEEEEEEEEAGSEDDDDDDDHHKSSSATKKKRSKPSSSKKKSTSSSSSSSSSATGTGFMKLLRLSPPLAEFLGTEQMARPTIVKSMWEYIKKNQLQNPMDKREVVLDETLRRVFQRDSVTMFSMNRYLSRHVKKLDDTSAFELDGCGDSDNEETPKKKKKMSRKTQKRNSAMSDDDGGSSKKKAKRKNNAFTKPWVLSSDMAAFMKAPTAGRGAVVKQLWQHIKANNLQDPDSKKNIINDAVLRRLTGQAKMTCFSMNKHIQKHFIEAADDVDDDAVAAAAADDDGGDVVMQRQMPKLEEM